MLTYGNHSVDEGKLPEVTRNALLTRGFNHIMANETASIVASAIEKSLAGTTDESKKAFEALSKEDRKAAFKAFRDGNSAQVTAWESEARDGAIADMLAGELGVRASGPRVDPVTAKVQSLARKEVIDTLKGADIKVPKKTEDVVTFADGTTRTMAQMVERRIARDGDRLRKEAEKQIADEARRAAKSAADAKGKVASAGGAVAEALGL